MTEKELKKLNRAELLEMLIAQAAEMEDLKAELEETNRKLADKEMKIENAGSIAEASLALSGIFEDAEKACATYIENIRNTDAYCEGKRNEADAYFEEKCREADKYSEVKIREAEEKAAEIEKAANEILEKTQNDSALYWKNTSAKLCEFIDSHPGLKEMLGNVDDIGE